MVLSLTCLIVVFVSNMKIVSLPLIPALVVWPKVQYVLGPLLFVLYTTPLSTLISFISLNHHLYADDTQLFFSFCPSYLESSIINLQNVLQQISSWMTANLLTLNSSKIEFLLIGLKQQLAKISFCSLDTVHSAHNLGFIFDEHIHQLRCIQPYLGHKTASTIATSIVHSLSTVTHSTTAYQMLN